MSNIYLVYPPANILINRTDRCQQAQLSILNSYVFPPMEFLFMAGILKNDSSNKVKIRDGNVDNMTLDDYIKEIQEFETDILIVNIALPSLENDFLFCDEAKKLRPNMKIIGVGPCFEQDEILNMQNSIELGIICNPEVVTDELLMQNKPLEIIKNLVWKNESGEWIHNEKDVDNLDLSTLPLPARELVDNTKYIRPDSGEPQALIRVEKGCPFGCFFCTAANVSGQKVHYRNIDNVIEEIKDCYYNYNIRQYILFADIFTFNKKWVTELCNKIIKLNIDITWLVNSRVDTVDGETLKLMKKAGCEYICFGVESGSDEILLKMGKKITTKQIKKTHKLAKKAKLKTIAHCIVGLPWETEKTAKETRDFLKKLNPNCACFYIATPFQNTPFFEYAKEHNLIKEEDFESSYFSAKHDGHYLSSERITKLQEKAMKDFYIRPRKILSLCKQAKNFKVLKQGIKTIAQIAKKP